MPFKRLGRRTYYTGPHVVAGIEIPRISLGTTNKRTAIAMETMLRDLPARGYGDLVKQAVAGALELDELYAATLDTKSDDSLQAIRERESDRLLTEIIGERAKNEEDSSCDGSQKKLTTSATGLYAVVADERTLSGLDQLGKLLPAKARLSWLREPRNIIALYDQALRGSEGARPRKPNSVRRSLHRAVSELLSRELGRGKMLYIMADVKVPHAPDERVVMLSSEEIVSALRAADPVFRAVIGLAVTTGIDRSAMQATRVRHYDSDTGALNVVDQKTTSRPRTLILREEPLLENSERWIRDLVAGRLPHEPLVDLTDRQFRTHWEAVREKIGRPEVRWKDLRGVFATYYLQAGGEPRDLQHILGHSAMAMTLRYLRRVPPGNKDRQRAAARRVGRLEVSPEANENISG